MDRQGHQTTPNIKIKSEHNGILIDIRNEQSIKSGVKAAGWMSKHVLWNKPTLQASVADINKTFKHLDVSINET